MWWRPARWSGSAAATGYAPRWRGGCGAWSVTAPRCGGPASCWRSIRAASRPGGPGSMRGPPPSPPPRWRRCGRWRIAPGLPRPAACRCSGRIVAAAAVTADPASTPRVVIRLDFPGGGRVGHGKVALLEGVARTGSIAAAARAMAVSYPRARALVAEVDALPGGPAVARAAGGAGGGRAALTP